MGPDQTRIQPRSRPGSKPRLEPGQESGAQLRVLPGRDGGLAGVGAGLEPRAGAHRRCSQVGWDTSGSGQDGDIRARPTRWRSELEPETRAGSETEPETRPNPSGPQQPEADPRPEPVLAPALSLELLVRGAESRWAGPSRRARAFGTRGSGARDSASQRRPPRAGGPPAATLLAQRPQPT